MGDRILAGENGENNLMTIVLSVARAASKNYYPMRNHGERAELEMELSDHGFDPALIDEWVEIWNSYDLSMVDELFLADSRVTYFSSEKEGVIKGIDALRDHHRGFGFVEGGKYQPNRLWLEDIHLEDFGQTAIVTAIWCFQRDGSEKVQKGPVTLVYLLTEAGHKIAHANFANY